MDQIGKVVYDNLIDIEHLHYEHIIFALEAHSQLIKERMLAAYGRKSPVDRKRVERTLIRVSNEAIQTVKREIKEHL